MTVFEIRMKVFLLRDIPLNQVQMKIASFLDRGFLKGEELARFHKENRYKGYSMDLFYPMEKDRIYKRDKTLYDNNSDD